MFALVDSVLINKDQVIKTDAGKFMFVQRNQGFAENDGKWIVTQLPELFWRGGVMHERRPSHFLGVFGTPVDAIEAVEKARPQPVNVRMVRAY